MEKVQKKSNKKLGKRLAKKWGEKSGKKLEEVGKTSEKVLNFNKIETYAVTIGCWTTIQAFHEWAQSMGSFHPTPDLASMMWPALALKRVFWNVLTRRFGQ